MRLWRAHSRRVSIPTRFGATTTRLQAIVLALILTPPFLFFPSSPWLQITEKALRRVAHAARKITGSTHTPSRSFSPLLILAASLDSDMSSAFLASHARG